MTKPNINKTPVPLGMKYTRAVNCVAVVVLTACSLAAVFLGFAQCYPELLSGIESSGAEFNPAPFAVVFIVSALMWLLPLPLLMYCNRGLMKKRKPARTIQACLAAVLVFYYPFGTVLYGVVLYFLLIDKKVKEFFSGEPQHG